MSDIRLIASLLHLPAIDNGIEARRAVEGGSYLVREDDVKAVVVKLRKAYDKRNAEMKVLREGLKAAVELLDCAMGVPCRPDLDDKIRAAIAKATT